MSPFYECDNITIYCGDCLEVMPQLEGSFDAIIADLPYGTTACDWDDVIPLEPLWIEYKRLIKGNGAVVLFGKQPFVTDLVNSNREWFKYEHIWDKRLSSEWHSGKYRPLLIHENILVFSNGTCANGGKNPMIYNPQMSKREKDRHGTFGENAEKYKNPKSHGRKPITKTLTHRYPTSILDYSGADKTNIAHPTQKPVELLRYLIRTYTNPGDLILDNTMGSGTTLVAAQIEGRRAVGIDISEKYCQIAVDRLKPPGFLALLQDGKQEAQQIGLLG